MQPSVAKVVPAQEYILLIDFDNGEQGVLDMKPYLHFGIFQRLNDIDIFKQVQRSFDTVAWPVGIDLDPAFVYEKCRRVCAHQDLPADAEKQHG